MVPELVVLDTHRNLPTHINSDLLTTCKPGWSYRQQAAYQIFLLAAVYLAPLNSIRQLAPSTSCTGSPGKILALE